MPIGSTRDKILRGIHRKRGRAHRYSAVRWTVGVACTVLIALLPLSGTLRVDLWGGRHLLLGRDVDTATAAKAFAFPFLAVNLLIIVASRLVGRYLCGFGCPYGALARLTEWFRTARGGTARRAWRQAALLGSCLLLAAVTFSFWVDWRVFVEGSARARILAGAFVAIMTAAPYLTLLLLGQRFCRDWCPSGVYFALLGHDSRFGVEFAHPAGCTECGACEKVCPVDLKPKEMSGGAYRQSRGLYGERLSNFANCIRCGDCVVACEGSTASLQVATPLELGWLAQGARDSRAPVDEPARAAAPSRVRAVG